MTNSVATGVYLGLQSMYAQHLKLMYPGVVGMPLKQLKLYESGNPDVACEFLVKEISGVTRYILYTDCSLYVEVSGKLSQVTNKAVMGGMFEGLNSVCLCGEISDVMFDKESSSGTIVLDTQEYISCKITGKGVQIINTEKEQFDK